MTICIYVLICPIANRIRYIGKSNQPKSRLYHHMRDARLHTYGGYHGRWLRRLMQDDLEPELKIIYKVPDDMDWRTAEKFFIASCKSLRLQITNATWGGDGVTFVSEEAKAQYKALVKKTMADPAMIARRNAAIKESFTRPDRKAKHVAACKAAAMKPERHKKLIEAARLPRSPEVKARQKAGIQRWNKQKRVRKAAALAAMQPTLDM